MPVNIIDILVIGNSKFSLIVNRKFYFSRSPTNRLINKTDNLQLAVTRYFIQLSTYILIMQTIFNEHNIKG